MLDYGEGGGYSTGSVLLHPPSPSRSPPLFSSIRLIFQAEFSGVCSRRARDGYENSREREREPHAPEDDDGSGGSDLLGLGERHSY
jgi:hypothetical protein